MAHFNDSWQKIRQYSDGSTVWVNGKAQGAFCIGGAMPADADADIARGARADQWLASADAAGTADRHGAPTNV